MPRTVHGLHRLAYVYALCERPATAVELLSTALELGLSPELVRSEDEFESLRGNPAFEALIASG